jgi:hypothetical protein
MLTWSSTFQIPLRTTLSLSTNNNALGDGLSDFQYQALSAFGEYELWRGLKIFSEFRYTQSDGMTSAGVPIDVVRNHIRAGGSLHVRSQHMITLEAHYITYSSGQQTDLLSSYADTVVRLRYEKLF